MFNYSHTLHGTAIYAYIDPPNHPNRSANMAVPWSVWDFCFFVPGTAWVLKGWPQQVNELAPSGRVSITQSGALDGKEILYICLPVWRLMGDVQQTNLSYIWTNPVRQHRN